MERIAKRARYAALRVIRKRLAAAAAACVAPQSLDPPFLGGTRP
jgi:hypothetical protein